MHMQAEEARRRQVREVAYDLQRRVKQELAFPAVIHFYCWLLQGDPEKYLTSSDYYLILLKIVYYLILFDLLLHIT